MFKNKPIISVIMSVRNGEKYVADSIRSMLNQSFKDFEFIILNDASIDNTLKIINKIKDKRLKVISNSRKKGLTKSLNICLKICKGKYIARMDHDDIARPDRFQKQISFLEQNPKVGVVGSWVEIIDSWGKSKGLLKFPKSQKTILNKIFLYNPIRHSTVMFRKELVNKYGFYDANLDGAEDYDLWLRFSRHTKIANINIPLVKYRIHEDSVSEKEEKKVLKAAIKARIKAIFKYNYSLLKFVYLILPVISYFIPKNIKILWQK